ncbi:MAG: anti-sigma factor [Kangiellaceae bacterium]|nr:anti-sigma factor [Kangiellaceae bacterium]MCW8999580.1 anti-sigma factor [Kangiellaceae bacterium]
MNVEQTEMNDEKFEKLSGYLDGELTQQEAQRVSLLIETDPEYKSLYQELSMMRSEIQSLSLQEQELEHLDKLFEEPVAKTSRIFGFALIAVSAVFVIGFTFYKIFTNPAIGLLEKVLVGAVGSGTLLLLFSVLRQRLISMKKDKYKRVKI